MATKCFGCRRRVDVPQYARTGDGKNRPFCPPCRKKVPRYVSRNTKDHFGGVSPGKGWNEKLKLKKIGYRWFNARDLVATQRKISSQGINHYQTGRGATAPATVVRIGWRNYLWNGHHRTSVNGGVYAQYWK
jgi:hypothetical protein